MQTNEQIRYYDPTQKPFSVYGVFVPDEAEPLYRRMPAAAARAVSEGVEWLCRNTSGGRIRLRTDARRLYLKAVFPGTVSMEHFAQSGVTGFSVYAEKDGQDTFCGILAADRQTELEGSVDLLTDGMKTVTVYMPLYNNVETVRIGFDASAAVLPDSGYGCDKPVVFYGSSITQGGCASRAGSDYAAILSRRLNFDYINLGFSGNAKGERAMADYICTLPMQAFVMDYDHNAPTPEHLRQTHEPFFRVIRRAHPDLPVLFLSRPCSAADADSRARFAIIRQTYENARESGDRNVYLIDGSTFFADAVGLNDPTVDRVHPTDLGFYLMAKAIEPCLARMLQK